MCDDEIHQGIGQNFDVSRRVFGAGAAATAVLASGPTRAEAQVVEQDVSVKTPDGSADAALFHPAGKGSWPALRVATAVPQIRRRTGLAHPQTLA